MRGELHKMVKEYGVDLSSQKYRQNHSAQNFRTGPSVGDCQVKDYGIQNPKPIGVYASSLDEPFGTLVKQWIVLDPESDGFFDKGRAAGRIQRGMAVFSFNGETREHKYYLEGRDDGV
mmetsp:Transcript_3021/g.6269  ORF Transcript_3021/g.6269 Transcript_3021/m.6269 type:complete len:118 (-) Transcript_3021:129-482(-)